MWQSLFGGEKIYRYEQMTPLRPASLPDIVGDHR